MQKEWSIRRLLPQHLDGSTNIATPERWQLRQCFSLAVGALQEASVEKQPGIVHPNAYSDKILAGMLDNFCAALQSAQPQLLVSANRFVRQQRLVKKAIDYINAHCSETLQIGLMCAELGTTIKTLERSFLRLYGTTPKRYVDLARLTKARQHLLRLHETRLTISEVAADCGINHLGRFAQRYQATYGELPSETAGGETPMQSWSRH
jgi:AraC-like DNA-binding protein